MPVRLEALPLKLDFCYTRVARGGDADWIARRFRAACARLGTDVAEEQGRLVVTWEPPTAGEDVAERRGLKRARSRP
jgi:poly-gamma-glutamate synthesis protein (capsule biosynthesis protein)